MTNDAGVNLGLAYSIVRDAEREMLDGLRQRGIEAGLGEMSRITLREMAQDAYWAVPELEVDWLATVFGMEVLEFLEFVCPSYTSFECDKCHEDIPVFCENRRDRDRWWGIALVCSDCEAKENRAAYEARERAALAKERAERDAQRAAHVAALKALPYREYLASDHWQAVRRSALEWQGDHCQICRGGGVLNVHHNTYERRGEEALGDLLVLCAGCHQLFHENGRLAKPPVE